MRSLGLRGETRLVKHPVEEISRSVTGEHSPRAVRAMGPRRQADDQQTRIRISERGNWLPTVVPVAIRSPLLGGDLAAVGDQARTPLASNNLPLDLDECTLAIHGLEKTPEFSNALRITRLVLRQAPAEKVARLAVPLDDPCDLTTHVD